MMEASKETPAVDTNKEIPMMEASKEPPAVDTNKEIPVEEASKETHAIELKKGIPLVERSKTPQVESSKATEMMETNKDGERLEYVSESPVLIPSVSDIAQSPQDSQQHLDDNESRDKLLESSEERGSSGQQKGEEETENLNECNNVQKPLSSKIDKEFIQNSESVAGVPQPNFVEPDVSKSTSLPTPLSGDKQQSAELETESSIMTNALDLSSATSRDTIGQLASGCNKENENKTITADGTATPSSATCSTDGSISTPVNGEAEENERHNNSGDESALVIDDCRDQERPMDTENPLLSTQETAKVLPDLPPNVASKAPGKSNRRGKPRTPSQTPKFDKEDLEHLRLPEKHGWKREVVYRGTFDQDSRKSDVYYHPPFGKKLRSMIDIGNFLDKQKNYPLNRTHFTFRKEQLFEPPFEIVRSANVRSAQPVKDWLNSKNKQNSDSNSSPPVIKKLSVKLPGLQTPKSSPRQKKTFLGRTYSPSTSNASTTAQSTVAPSPRAHQGMAATLKTNGTGSSFTQLARGALQHSLNLSNTAGKVVSSQAGQQPSAPQSQIKAGFGFGVYNKQQDREKPAATWKIKVTPKINNKKPRPRQRSPDWRPSDEALNSSDESDAESNIEIIKHGAGETEDDEMQRVMGTTSDLIASIVRQNKPGAQTLPTTTQSVGFFSGNSLLTTSSLQPPRTTFIPTSDPRVMLVRKLSQNTAARLGLPSLLPKTPSSNMPYRILTPIYAPSPPAIISAGSSSIFPPPPPLASCPTIRTVGPPPLQMLGSNPPTLVIRPGRPRAPPALQPCPSLLEQSLPGHIIRPSQPAPAPPLAHRTFTPNILQRQGAHKSSHLAGSLPTAGRTEDTSKAPQVGQDETLPAANSGSPETVVSSDEEDVLCIDQDPQAERDNSSSRLEEQPQRKRPSPSDSNSSDEENADQSNSKRLRLELSKLPEPNYADADHTQSAKNLGKKIAEQETEAGEGGKESTQGSAVIRGILNKPPQPKNVLPPVSDTDSEYDEDDEFLPPVTFAAEETSESLPAYSEKGKAPDVAASTSSGPTPATEANTLPTIPSRPLNETVPLSRVQMPAKSFTPSSSAKLLTLPPELKEKLDLKRPLLLNLNGQEFTIPPVHVLTSNSSLKVLLPPGTKMDVSGSAKTLSVAVSNVPKESPHSGPQPRLKRRTYLSSSFRPLQGCVGIMTRLFRLFSLPQLLRICLVNKSWLKMFHLPSTWETVSFRNMYVTDWEKAKKFLQKVCVKKLSLAGMVLRRDLEAKSWQRIETIAPLITSLNGIHFGRVPANVIMSLMEKMPETVNISADVIIDSNDPQVKKMKATMGKYSDKQVENMASALSLVENGTSPAEAATRYNVLESDILHLQQGRQHVLTPQEESLVVLCCIRLAQMGFTIGITSFLIKCQEMFARRYSTEVPIPIFDDVCRQIYQRNLPFFNVEQNPGSATNVGASIDRHYSRLIALYEVTRPSKITAEQVYTFDIQTFRLKADPYALPRRANANATVLWATNADSLNIKPAMLITSTDLQPDPIGDKLIVVKAKNGVATPAHIQQYFRKLIKSATKSPIIVLCSTDASNFSESLVTMCLQSQVYIANIHSNIAKFVFPGHQGGLLHLLREEIPPMALKESEFLQHLKFLLQNGLLKILISTKRSFTATGTFPVNRQAPTQYQPNKVGNVISGGVVPTTKMAAKTPTHGAPATQKQPVLGASGDAEQVDSDSEMDESEEDSESESKKSDSSASSDVEMIDKPQENITASCRPSTLLSTAKPAEDSVSEPAVQGSPNEKEKLKSTGEEHTKGEPEKVDKLGKFKKQPSRLVQFARDLILKARRGRIKRSSHKYKPLRPLKPPALPVKEIIKLKIDGSNIISTLPFNLSKLESSPQEKHKQLTPDAKSLDESHTLEHEPPALVIDTSEKEEIRDPKPQLFAKVKTVPVSTESASKIKASVFQHIREAIDAVVEESREYARQVERGGSHGDEIMPETWMKRNKQMLAPAVPSGSETKSAFVKKMKGMSIVLKTGSGKEQEQTIEEEESELEEEEGDEEEEDKEEEADEEDVSSNEDEGEGGVEWTVSSQPKHSHSKPKKKKHKKQKKKHKKEEEDSDEETPQKEEESRKKRKKAKKKHKKKRSKSAELEVMDTSQDLSTEKQASNDNKLDEEADKADLKEPLLPSNVVSGDTTDTNTFVSEEIEGVKDFHEEKISQTSVQVQPSYVSDHDYFSKFVDEDCVNMDEMDSNIQSEKDVIDWKENDNVTSEVANAEGTSQGSMEHDYSKAAGKVVEASDMSAAKEESSVPGQGSVSSSSDASSEDSDNDSSSGSSKSSSEGSTRTSSSTSSSQEEGSDSGSESEPINSSSISREQSRSPKKKVKTQSSSSEASDTSGSDSSESESESEEEKKKKKRHVSYESGVEEESEEEEAEEDKCQLCMRSTPPHSKDVLINWIDCDKNCGRWFHVICIQNSKFRAKSKSKNSKSYICPSCR